MISHHFLRIRHQFCVHAFSNVFHSLAVKTVGEQFIQPRLEVGGRFFTLIVSVFDERPHERPLIERNDAMYVDQLQPVCEIKLQAPVTPHVPRFVSQIGDQFRRWHVTRVGFFEQISQGGADHVVDDLDVFRSQRVCVVPFV